MCCKHAKQPCRNSLFVHLQSTCFIHPHLCVGHPGERATTSNVCPGRFPLFAFAKIHFSTTLFRPKIQWVDGIPDETVDKVVSGNVLSPYGNECVDIKEGAAYNIVEDNIWKEQYDDDAGCFGSRGDVLVKLEVLPGYLLYRWYSWVAGLLFCMFA